MPDTMNYPYSKQQISLLFKSRPNPREPVYNFNQSKQYLKKQLEDMDTYGYDFPYKQWNFKRSAIKVHRKIMRRRVYTRINCSRSCLMNQKKHPEGQDEQQDKQLQEDDSKNPPKKVPKRWTTYYGCAEVRFAVVDLKRFLQQNKKFESENMTIQQEVELRTDKKIVLWDLYIYREQCKQCRRYGYTQIYHCQMEAIARAFCKIIAEILAGIKQKRYVEDNQKTIREPPQHETTLCEACKKNVCFWLTWKKRYDAQQERLALAGDTSSGDEQSDSSSNYESDEDNEQNGSHHELDQSEGDD